MRIAQIVTRMDVGGVPDHVMTLLRGLAGRHALTLIAGDVHPRHAAELAALGVTVERLPFARLPDPRRDLAAFLRLRRMLAAGRFDVAHTHMSKAALLGALAAGGCRRRPWLLVNTAHNLGSLALPAGWRRAAFRAYDRWLLGRATDHVIVVSARVRAQVTALGLMAPDHVTAIANGIALERFPGRTPASAGVRAALGVGPDEVLLLCVARLVWFKGLDTLLDAFAAAPPQTRLAIVGAGELREALAAQAEAAGVAGRVAFLGERADVPELLGAADAFVLSSVSEGMPISIIEAMASGLPVIATDVGGVREIVEDGVTGLLVPARAQGPLAAAIARLATEPATRAAFGAAARARAQAEFAGAEMAEGTEALYARLLGGRVAP